MSNVLAFFATHTPRYCDPETFEPVPYAAHVIRCRGLVDAERWAQKIGLSFAWIPDGDSLDTLTCLATYNGEIVAETSGVDLLDGADGFARVVQAELSQEFWHQMHTLVRRAELAIC